MDVINNTNELSNSTTEDELSGLDVAHIVGKVLFFLFGVIGIVSNIALIRTYKKKDLSVRFNSLMLILAIFDLATIALFILTGIVQLTVVLDPGFNAVLLYLDVIVVNCTAYTMAAIALDRYLICRNQIPNQSQLPILPTMVKVTVISMILLAPYHRWYPENFLYHAITRSWHFLITFAIPCTALMIFSVAMYKKLQLWKESNEFDNKSNMRLRKSVQKIRLTLSICSIFVLSQITAWAPRPYEVSYIQFIHITY